MLSIIPGAADFTAADLQKGRKIRAFLHNFVDGSATGSLSIRRRGGGFSIYPE
jgi:hypothetical protein